MEKKKETASAAMVATNGRELKTELFMMIQQLKGALHCADLYLELPDSIDSRRQQKISEAKEKINEAINDVACVIGWEVMDKE